MSCAALSGGVKVPSEKFSHCCDLLANFWSRGILVVSAVRVLCACRRAFGLCNGRLSHMLGLLCAGIHPRAQARVAG